MEDHCSVGHNQGEPALHCNGEVGGGVVELRGAADSERRGTYDTLYVATYEYLWYLPTSEVCGHWQMFEL